MNYSTRLGRSARAGWPRESVRVRPGVHQVPLATDRGPASGNWSLEYLSPDFLNRQVADALRCLSPRRTRALPINVTGRLRILNAGCRETIVPRRWCSRIGLLNAGTSAQIGRSKLTRRSEPFRLRRREPPLLRRQSGPSAGRTSSRQEHFACLEINRAVREVSRSSKSWW